MGMSLESCPGLDLVIIEHAQDAELHIFRIKIFGKGKMKAADEPAMVGNIQISRRYFFNHFDKFSFYVTTCDRAIEFLNKSGCYF